MYNLHLYATATNCSKEAHRVKQVGHIKGLAEEMAFPQVDSGQVKTYIIKLVII